jgi:selenocysteine lyase/cysteine desulfurase
LRAAIAQIPGCFVVDPPTRDLRATALVAIATPAFPRGAAEALWRQNLFVHPTDAGVRVSLASFNVQDDVDRLVQGLADVCEGRRRGFE